MHSKLKKSCKSYRSLIAAIVCVKAASESFVLESASGGTPAFSVRITPNKAPQHKNASKEAARAHIHTLIVTHTHKLLNKEHAMKTGECTRAQ